MDNSSSLLVLQTLLGGSTIDCDSSESISTSMYRGTVYHIYLQYICKDIAALEAKLEEGKSSSTVPTVMVRNLETQRGGEQRGHLTQELLLGHRRGEELSQGDLLSNRCHTVRIRGTSTKYQILFEYKLYMYQRATLFHAMQCTP